MKRRRLRILVFVVGALLPGPLWSTPGQAQPPEVAEVETKTVKGLEVTLVVAPPLSPEEMARWMGGMGMEEMMPGMPGMRPMMPKPTHYMGAIVRDGKTGRVLQGLKVMLEAQSGDAVVERPLMAMPGSYAHNIALPKKGRYIVVVRVERPVPAEPVEVSFDFEYR